MELFVIVYIRNIEDVHAMYLIFIHIEFQLLVTLCLDKLQAFASALQIISDNIIKLDASTYSCYSYVVGQMTKIAEIYTNRKKETGHVFIPI